MTNKGFYGDKLLAIVLEDTCRKLRTAVYGESCAEKDCKDCEFYTVERVENWLNAEHEEPEPPLLENGDDLEPGDWIMVRDEFDDGWKNERSWHITTDVLLLCAAAIKSGSITKLNMQDKPACR